MLNILPFIKPPKGWTVRSEKSLAVPRGLLHLSVIGLLVFTQTSVSHVEMVLCCQTHTHLQGGEVAFPLWQGMCRACPLWCLLRGRKTISEALETFLLCASFSGMWDKSHLEASLQSEVMSSAWEPILGHKGFFNFILFYFLRYKFRNSLKLCP